jgi:alanyl-tRNA synthetase
MTVSEIRTKYLEFFRARGHAVVPSARLVPENDPTTLFTSSGMQPMVPYLLGQPHPQGTRIADSQKSFRAGDIEEIGDNRHTTLFEMLGNWSLGDYFKKEQIPWIFEFLTGELGLPAERLCSTTRKRIGGAAREFPRICRPANREGQVPRSFTTLEHRTMLPTALSATLTAIVDASLRSETMSSWNM